METKLASKVHKPGSRPAQSLLCNEKVFGFHFFSIPAHLSNGSGDLEQKNLFRSVKYVSWKYLGVQSCQGHHVIIRSSLCPSKVSRFALWPGIPVL